MTSVGGTIRLSGLASGMDIDTLVQDLMKTERTPLDSLSKKKQFLIWQREDYRTINTSMLAFRKAAEGLKYEKNFNQTVASSSDDKVASIVSSSSSFASTFQVQVDQLATGATMVGGAMEADLTKALGASGTLTINDVDIKIDSKATIDAIVTSINNQTAKTGVQASIDKNSKQLMLMTKDTGSTAKIDLSMSDNLSDNLAETLKLTAGEKEGTNAEYSINGSTLITSSSNTINVNGVQLQLKSVGQSSVGVQSDTSGLVNSIKTFVDKYNELIDLVTTSTSTKRNRDYSPLTDDEKEAMTDSQIEKWEAKAREGTLFSDSLLQGLTSSLRNSINTEVKGMGSLNLLADIGIKVMDGYKNNGKLEIDEKKLNNALTNNFEEVKKLFTKTSSTEATTAKDLSTRRSEQGFAERLYEEIDSQMQKLMKKMGSSTGTAETIDQSVIGKQLKIFKEQEDRLTSRLTDIENRYYKRFTAMETAIQKLNSQGSWLSQQLGQ